MGGSESTATTEAQMRPSLSIRMNRDTKSDYLGKYKRQVRNIWRQWAAQSPNIVQTIVIVVCENR